MAISSLGDVCVCQLNYLPVRFSACALTGTPYDDESNRTNARAAGVDASRSKIGCVWDDPDSPRLSLLVP